MNLLNVILIAVGLSMDCFAVSISKGICVRRFHAGRMLRMALLFGLFQGFMPLIGFGLLRFFAQKMEAYDHWIALALLGFLGGKMIWESFKKEEDGPCVCAQAERQPMAPAASEAAPALPDKDPAFSWKVLLVLAVATSIDALCTGVIFVTTPEWMLPATALITGICFAFSCAGYGLGQAFGRRFRFNAELVGGLILIAIGVKILVEHLWG